MLSPQNNNVLNIYIFAPQHIHHHACCRWSQAWIKKEERGKEAQPKEAHKEAIFCQEEEALFQEEASLDIRCIN